MQSIAPRLQHAKEFAEQAGVTVRTLHVYDRLGLLRPATRTEAGYRLYGEAELEKLEQILALRFLGFRLDYIKELLRGPKWPLVVALRMQREIVAQQRRKLDAALLAIERAQAALETDEFADRWEMLRSIMETFKVQDDYNWTKNYYSEEAQAKIAERAKNTPKEVIEQGQRDWAALIAEVEDAAAKNEDPAGEHAQQLAGRWRGLVSQFTGGDAAIHEGLNRLWSDPAHWPKDFKKPWSDAADAWIKSAMNCAR